MHTPAFLTPLALPSRPSRRAHALHRTLHPTAHPSTASFPRIRRCAVRACARESVAVGQVVAVERGRNIVDLAQITGVSSSGDTVDLTILRPFVKELYVQSENTTYEKVVNIRPVISEYAPSQNGWIILDADLVEAKNYFEMRNVQQMEKQSVAVSAEPRKDLSEEALKRQFFKPSKTQAYLASALGVPLAAAFYAAYASVRDAYANAPDGDALMSGAMFRSITLLTLETASLASLVVAVALFLYANSMKSEQEQ